jgi:predicted transcriptional regulator
MQRLDILEKIIQRKKELGLTIDNIAKLAKLGNRTVTRLFAGEDVKLSTWEKITTIMGLDFAGNEVVDIETLKEQRAKEKAIYIVSLVQDTSTLEMQGLEDDAIEMLIQETKQEFLSGKYQKKLWAS